MKCDKLKAEPMIINDDYTALYYPKDSVDAAIDELKREHHRERHEYIDMVAQHKAKLVEQESENRKLKRALWMARAKRATEKADSFIDIKVTYCGVCNINHSVYPEKNARRMLTCDEWLDVWTNVWEKCLKKAKEFV